MVYHEANCDVETGDVVQIANTEHKAPYIINEIRLVQYVKANIMIFEFQLTPAEGEQSGTYFVDWLKREEFIYPHPTYLKGVGAPWTQA